jgi:hypothetical protein
MPTATRHDTSKDSPRRSRAPCNAGFGERGLEELDEELDEIFAELKARSAA